MLCRLGLAQDAEGTEQRPWKTHRATRMHFAASLVLLSVLTSACATETSTSADPGMAAGQPVSVRPEPNSRNCEDLNLATSLAQYTTAWNTAAEPFVAGYADPNISGDEWLTGGATNLAAMEQAAVGLRGGVANIHDRQLGSMLMSISDNYQVKLLAAKALVTSVETGNTAAQSAASEQLRAAGLAGRNLALDLKDMVEASPQFAAACP